MTDSRNGDLGGLRVLLSASIPEGVAGTPGAQDLYSAVAVLTRRILAAGGHLVFGGHPSVTPLILRAAAAVDRGPAAVTLYQAINFRDQAPAEVHDPSLFPNLHWVGDPAAGIPENLSALREAMALDSAAAVLIGGRGEASLTREPGLREEYRRFRAHHPGGPVYLVGLLGGEARRMAQEAAAGTLAEPNGLDEESRREVRFGRNLDLIGPAIARDLAGRRP